jgi:acetylornithine deacetylase/succinyl-diaminopimelate desuccinylase-like protein
VTRQPAPCAALAAVVLLASAVHAAAPPDAATVRDAARAWRRAHARGILEEFTRLLAIPNIAGDVVNLNRNARQLTIMLKKRGFDVHALATNSGGAPVVFGELPAPGATRTVVIYAHYDGQPVDPKQWHGDPFAPVLRDRPLEAGGRERTLDELAAAGDAADEWRLYGRSTSDDKAPVIGVLAALDALRAAQVPLSVNLKVFFEGEEEAGSPELETILRARVERLKADLWLLCDGPVHQSRRMQLFFGARGVTGVELTVYGPARALHSGHYGNWVPNPAVELAHLLASMRDRDGRVIIDGFGDAVRPPTDAERRALASVPDADEALRGELALQATEAGNARLIERLMLPALNVRGIESGHVGALASNAIPTTARASIDFRLVPDQTPEGVRAAVEAHLRRQGFHVVHDEPGLDLRRAHPRVVRAEWGAGYPAARTDMDLPIARDVRRVVDEAVGGTLVVVPTLGGSIPMHVFTEVLGAPVIGVPVANHDNNQHAADENLRLRNLWDAIEIYAALLARLGRP